VICVHFGHELYQYFDSPTGPSLLYRLCYRVQTHWSTSKSVGPGSRVRIWEGFPSRAGKKKFL